MLLTVREFTDRVNRSLADLIGELQYETGREGSAEREAWTQSLAKLASVLADPTLACLHLYIQAPGTLALEYQLPASGMFADVVLLGQKATSPSAVVIELKHWLTRADRAGRAEGLIERAGVQELHPSDQVRGYVEYCRRFHSAVQSHAASVRGCVLMTRDLVCSEYRKAPNDKLVDEYPIFTMAKEDLGNGLSTFLCAHLDAANEAFAEAFVKGGYKQERGFIKQIARQLLRADARPFELLDNQRRALHLCKVAAHEVVSNWTQRGEVNRRVLAVIGPPGSGKSAVAARLWAEMSLVENVPEGDLVFVTTSMSQSSNWRHLFDGLGGGAIGVVRKASSYHPVASLSRLRRIHGENFLKTSKVWRENVDLLRSMVPFRSGAEDKATLISIVDEAHSLSNTEREGVSGPVGFEIPLGPQAYHIIRASVLSVFFLDPEQGFRHKENTSLQDLKDWAAELGAGEVEILDLSGVQFRCNGSVEYMSWVESLLSEQPSSRSAVLASAWHLGSAHSGGSERRSAIGEYPTIAVAEPQPKSYGNLVVLRPRTRTRAFDFSVYDNPFAMEDDLRMALSSGATGRLLSTFSRPWATQSYPSPHDLPPTAQDFHEPCMVSGSERVWSRVWNCVGKNMDYSPYIQGRAGSRIAIDPLAEVGCPVAVRGFDFDYVGVLWLEDLVWRQGKWMLNLNFVKETGLKTLVSKAKKERGSGRATDELILKVQQSYRILLSRALRGVFVWIKDSETRQHVRASLG